MNEDEIGDALYSQLETEFAVLRDTGYVPGLRREHGWIVARSEFEDDRDWGLYTAGRIAGLSEAIEIIEDLSEEGDV